MKEQLILWLGSAIITFLVLYFANLTGSYYPLSGTFSIDGKKVTYKFDKIHRGDDQYNVLIRKDIKDAEAFLVYKKPGLDIQRIKMTDSGEVYKGLLPIQKPMDHIYYQAQIIIKDRAYFLPADKAFIPIIFLGRVPSAIMNLYYFFLYGGIFLSIRGALEFFNKNKKLKVFVMFAAIFFFCYTVAVTPLKSSYELGAIANSVPSIEKLFNLQSILLFVTWMTGMALIIGSKKPGVRGIIFAAITIAIYLLVPVTY